MISELKKLLKASDCTAKFLILLLLRSPFDAVFTIINAIFLQQAFNAITRNNADSLAFACLSYGIANTCLFLYNGTVWSIYAPFVVRMEAWLRVRVFQKIASFSYQRIEEAPPGDWLTRLNTDVQMPFSQPIHFPHAICAVINICVSAVILWHLNSIVFGWVILFVIPHILVSQFLIARALPGLNKKRLEATAKNTSELTSLITCADIAALYDGQEFLISRFEQSSLELLRANMKIRAKNALSSAILPLFGLGGYLTLLIAASGWITQGKLTFGDLAAVFQYRGGVLAGALMLINCLISIQASIAGIKRLNETMSERV